MNTQHRPVDFDILSEYPNARRFKGWEGGCAYQAERAGTPVIIVDGRTMLEFVDEEYITAAALEEAVDIIEFDDEAERAAYIAREMAFGTDLKERPEE